MGASADVEDEGLLKPWDQKVGSFADSVWLNPCETIEDNGALAAVDGVETGIDDGTANADGEGGARNVSEGIRGFLGVAHFDWFGICRSRSAMKME